MPGQIVPLRPMTIGDILDGIFQLLRACAGPILFVLLLVVWPELLIRDALQRQLAPGLGSFDPDVVIQAYLANAGWLLMLALLGAYLGAVVAGALITLAGSADRGARLTGGQALRIGFARSGSTFGATILMLLSLGVVALALSLVGAILAVINGWLALIYLMPTLAFLLLGGFALAELVVVAAVEEGRSAGSALARGVRLLWRNFFRVIGVTALVLILLVAIFVALFLLFELLSGILGPLSWVIEVLASVLFAAIAGPVTAAAGFLIHRDARVRLEGYDLQVRASTLRGGPR